ncbi:hypothetical protein E1301_Tti024231 [Triplophysa tibetana]|uniref:Interleukin-6 n=1 Tax=Triplophysa tibetana TaxID=1572043 RepID=A0A5A9NKP6_9TELE|nr:hypothetical protein E1301_Tti024231 [Triplophysa tibetana]
MTSFEGLRINTPVIKASDGCLSRNFSRERCLGRLYSVLMWYEEHLSYIERENLTQTITNDVKHGTKRFLESIYSKVNTPEAFPARLAAARQVCMDTQDSRALDLIQLHKRDDRYMQSHSLHEQTQNWSRSPEKGQKETSDWISDKN